MKRARSSLTLLIAIIGSGACSGGCSGGSSGNPAPGSGGSSGGGTGGSTVTGNDAGTERGDTGGACANRPDLVGVAPACNTFTNRATAVPFTAATGTPPTFNGGAVRDGLYESTRTEGYGSAAAAGRRISIVIQNGATQWLWNGEVLDAAGAQVTRAFQANATVSISGKTVTFGTPTCLSAAPSPLPDSLSYQVSGDDLLLAIEGPNAAVTTYTRRGCP